MIGTKQPVNYVRIFTSIGAALALFALIVFAATLLGIEESNLRAVFLGALGAGFVFGLMVWFTYFSVLGIIFFIAVTVVGYLVKIDINTILTSGVLACLVVSIVIAYYIRAMR